MGGGYIGRGISCLRLPVSTPEGTPYNPYSNECRSVSRDVTIKKKRFLIQLTCKIFFLEYITGHRAPTPLFISIVFIMFFA